MSNFIQLVILAAFKGYSHHGVTLNDWGAFFGKAPVITDSKLQTWC